MQKKSKKIKGSVLVFTLIILSLTLMTALAIAAVTVTERRTSGDTAASSQSFQVADSGIEKVLNEIYRNNKGTLADLSGCIGGKITTNIGSDKTYELTFKDDTGADITDCTSPATIGSVKSVGFYKGTTRAIETAVAMGYWTSDNGGVDIYNTNSTGKVMLGGSTNHDDFIIHPAGDLQVTGGGDSTWALYDKDMHVIIGWDNSLDHMGIAGDSDPAFTLRIHGSIAYNGGGDLSDVRYKKNIGPIQNALSKIINLNGVMFDWNRDKYPEEQFKEGKDIGLIAQDVEKVIPEVVLTDSQGYKLIEYQKLSALLIEGMKEQQKEVEDLKNQIEELRGEIKSLK